MHNASSETQPAARPAGVAASGSRTRVAIVLYSLVSLLYWASLFTYLPTLPTYAATITPDLALIGTILSMYGLWQALVRLPLGIASDWAGWRKPFIVVGLGLAAAGALVMGGARTPQALLVGRSITGLAAGTWVPLTVVFSALYPPEQAVRATTMLTVMSAFGRLLATTVTAPLNTLGGYGLAFTVAAVLAGISVLLVLPAQEVRRPVKAPTVAGTALLVTRRPVLLPAALNAVGHYVLMGIVYGFVPLLAKELGAPDSVASNLTVVHLAVFTPSVLAAAVLLRRFSARPLLCASFVAMGLGVMCGALAHSVPWLMAVQALVGIGFGISYPILMGMSIERVDGRERTTAMGVHQSVYAIGMFAGPWLCGLLAANMGIQPMFAVTAIGSLVIGILGTLWATAPARAAAGRA